MKLNKMLALALSGVMAVSMLAGCSGAPSNGEEGTEVQPTVSDAVTVMNDAQDYAKFGVDADLDAALKASAAKATFANINAAGYTLNDVLDSADADKAYDALEGKLPDDELTNSVAFDSVGDAARGKSITKTVLYRLNSNGLSEEAALKQFVNKQMSKASDFPESVKIDNKYYDATYTGAVSVVEVTATDAGKTVSAYYVAVSVTQAISMSATESVNK